MNKLAELYLNALGRVSTSQITDHSGLEHPSLFLIVITPPDQERANIKPLVVQCTSEEIHHVGMSERVYKGECRSICMPSIGSAEASTLVVGGHLLPALL